MSRKAFSLFVFLFFFPSFFFFSLLGPAELCWSFKVSWVLIAQGLGILLGEEWGDVPVLAALGNC